MENSHGYDGKFSLDIPIFKKTYDFFKEFYIFELDFPKKDRYTLGQYCEEYILQILKDIMLAAQITKDRKLPILESASGKLDMLKVFIRLTNDVDALSDKRYVVCQNHIQEIGKMLGGWIRSTRE
ncbi:MAG: diversity-generating retroelement protein Avd [Patescibacteria group bacterium]|nr:diversity-generating retroelement protein Avd [Patescibacteria group bacterium]MDE2438132.1 diversity-generating retroelement protein Avd [Patescibacteria group bacterium]